MSWWSASRWKNRRIIGGFHQEMETVSLKDFGTHWLRISRQDEDLNKDLVIWGAMVRDVGKINSALQLLSQRQILGTGNLPQVLTGVPLLSAAESILQ